MKMSEIYKQFAKDWPQADFSHDALVAMFEHESLGLKIPQSQKLNGFEIGKKWMDVTVAMWKEDIASSTLFVSELLKDYPDWFLDKVGILNAKSDSDKSAWLTHSEIKNA